ncbi:MAG TPA: acyl-CoA dehydrogenase family protein [Rhizomicrobium sp.]
MEFALSDDQKMMQDSVRRTLERVAPLDLVRKADKEPYAADVFAALRDLGVPGVLIPAEFGGLELGLFDAALIAEMLGRSVTPVPFVGSAVMAPLALMGAGSSSQKLAWLPKLASGETIAGVAISEHASGARDGAAVSMKNGKLNGRTNFVLDFAGADIFIVADHFAGLYLVQANARGLEKIALSSIDRTRTIGELVFGNVEAEPLTDGNAPATLDRMIDAGRAMLAADTLGAGEMMIEKAVAYAKERKQFGRIIGSFQAVKHLCAEMAAELEPCRALVWYASHGFDVFPEQSRRLTAHAKAHLSEVGQFVARTSTEVHGGMGFTDLLGLHYWFKRIGFNRQVLGGPERARNDAAIAQGWIAN